MDIQRISAFALNGQGGNPAGVVLLDELPDAAIMQAVAADVGYSETVFAAPQGNGFRTRYFAPQAEVPFCGHATIALGAALGAANGAGVYPLILNDTDVSVEAMPNGDEWSATLQSPRTGYRTADKDLVVRALDLFGWDMDDIDSNLEITRVNGGAEHLLIPLKTHALLQGMSYDFDVGAKLMQEFGLVTINLIWRDSDGTVHSRNPFAGHGVYEDPATGAAAAALAGYLRDAGHSGTPFDIYQGADMGAPSLLHVVAMEGAGSAVRITGATRKI
ncbi:MAG: PhzF family phenazine biosynthesis protein [Rhodobacteraceae bacterium]|nr:MAG: PhzF family phenazine biosynthesis protein [Paracoccaceae bacterium]